EIQTIISLATEIPSESIVSLDLYDEENPLVKTGPVNGASAVIPVAGMFDYSKIRSFIAKASTMDAAAKEGAVIAVLNGSGVTGAAQREADWLEEQGFDIGQIDNAPEGEYVSTKIYQRGDGMPATKKKLEDLYSTTIDGPPPVPINGEIDFLII